MTEIRSIMIVGAGNMGRQLAVHAALCGFDTVCMDIDNDTLAAAMRFTDDYLSGRVEKGRLSTAQAGEARERLRFDTRLGTAVRSADFVIEAVVERLDVKQTLFAELDRHAPSHAILASNSSAIASSCFADHTARPDRVLNMHFFNPVPVMKLVEIVQGPHVSDETAAIAVAVCRRLDKEPVHLKKEVDGFLLNRILMAVFKEAVWLHEMGVASIEDIDRACVLGAGHPMGPFRLNDLAGLDLVHTMQMEAFRKTGDPADLPSPSLVERCARGEFGEKSGKGWYTYRQTD
jgi:3-hydroxybutyryl-CoA dehydrogenase